jgi:hypothetical protein
MQGKALVVPQLQQQQQVARASAVLALALAVCPATGPAAASVASWTPQGSTS